MTKDGELSKWKPNLSMVSTIIEIANIGRLNAKIDAEEESQGGNEFDHGNESEDGEED